MARSYDIIQEQNNLSIEITYISKDFAKWGFDWENLVKKCPKQERSRLICHKITRLILEDEELTAEMLQKRQIPASRLSAKTGYSLDLFDNPVGCRTSLAVFQAKALQNYVF